MHDRLPPYVTLTPASPCFHVNCIPLKYTFGDLPHCLKPVGLRSPYFNTNYIFLSKTKATILLSHQKILSETFTYASKSFRQYFIFRYYSYSLFFFFSRFTPLIIPGPYRASAVVIYGSPKASRCRYANFHNFLYRS